MFALSFTYPAVLYGLAAAALPLLMHLMNRRRSVTVAFSNVALLQALQQDRMRRVKVKQWAVLALRTLLIALLVLAFARPTVRESSVGGSHGETSAVLLVDRSMSTQYQVSGQSLLSHSKDRVNEALELFNERDRVRLLSFDDSVKPSDASTIERVGLSLADLSPSYRATDPGLAIEAARRILLEDRTPNRELYVFSDITRKGWEELRDSYDGFEGATVFVIPSPEVEEGNVAVRSIRTTDFLVSVGRPTRLVAEVENFGAANVKELPVQVFVDGQRIGQKVIACSAGSRQQVSFRWTPEKGGARELRVEIPDDALLADNRRSSVLHIPERLKVGVMGEADERYYVQEALASGLAGSLEVTPIEPGSMGTEGYGDFDLLVLCNVRRLGRGEVSAIRRAVSMGAGLLVTLGEGIDLRIYNELVFPALCELSLTGIAGSRLRQDRFTSFDPEDAGHPTLSGLLSEDLTSPKFYARYRSRTSGATRAVLTFSSGDPALVENRVGDGRVMVLLSHTDLDWSDVSVTGFFAPFLHRAVRYLATGAFGSDDVLVGRRVTRSVSDLGVREAVVDPPEGPAQTVWAQQLGDRTFWVIDEMDQPGVWDIHSGGRVVDRFAVQVIRRESDPKRVDPAVFEQLFPGAEVVFIDSAEPLAAIVSEHRYGAELWRTFLLGALICLAVELALMSGETRMRDEAQGSSSAEPVYSV